MNQKNKALCKSARAVNAYLTLISTNNTSMEHEATRNNISIRLVRYVQEFVMILRKNKMNYLSYLHILKNNKKLKYSNCAFINEGIETDSIITAIKLLKIYLKNRLHNSN